MTVYQRANRACMTDDTWATACTRLKPLGKCDQASSIHSRSVDMMQVTDTFVQPTGADVAMLCNQLWLHMKPSSRLQKAEGCLRQLA